MLGFHHRMLSLMHEIVVHRSRHTTGLDIQPDLMIVVRFVCFRPNCVFDPD